MPNKALIRHEEVFQNSWSTHWHVTPLKLFLCRFIMDALLFDLNNFFSKAQITLCWLMWCQKPIQTADHTETTGRTHNTKNKAIQLLRLLWLTYWLSSSLGGRPNEAAAELLEWTPHPWPCFPAGGARQGGLHLIGHWPAGELFEIMLSVTSILSPLLSSRDFTVPQHFP